MIVFMQSQWENRGIRAMDCHFRTSYPIEKNMTKKNIPIQTTIINWGKLVDALKAGSEDYLFNRANGKSQEGFFHGGEGLRRAEFVRDYSYDFKNQLQILALLYAIFSPNPGFFESRSTALALCIAKELITGFYSREQVLDFVTEKNTLRSDVFTPDDIQRALPSSCKVSGTDTFSLTTLDITEEVRTILQSAHSAMPDDEKRTFDSHVKFFKAEATKKHSGRTADKPEPGDTELTVSLSPRG